MSATPVENAAIPPLRILVVEDHVDTANIMLRILSRDGHTVVVAGTLADAVMHAQATAFELIITDIELPDGVAYDLLEKLTPAPKAIVVSGHGMQSHIDRSKQAGFSEHLLKPFTIPQLRAAIHRVMGS